MKELLPAGARALVLAMQTPSPKGHIGIPTLIWGRPGVGKSSFVEALAKDDFPVLTLIASIHDPTDFSGLPVFTDGKVHYARPEWLDYFAEKKQGILFLDELTTAPPAVQAALLRVVLERKVGFFPLPDHVRVIAAANPPDMMTGGWDLSPPLRNRFVHLQWDLPMDVYLAGMTNGFAQPDSPKIPIAQHRILMDNWKLKIAAFLRQMPDALHGDMEEDEFAFASPRSWEYLAALLATCEIEGEAPMPETIASTACLELVRGCIGEGLGVAFISFLLELRLPDPEEILTQKTQIDLPQLNDSEVFVFFGALGHYLERHFTHEKLVDLATVYFSLVQTVFADERRDVIYPSLKHICQKGLLTKTLGQAQRRSNEDKAVVLAAIQSLFIDEGLNDFIDVFES
ncbi:AAA family ATPase [Lewinella sp. LCG006]|uniref:AAA family ATPase n=1 Tax=Lewinella sp. LCG006 TaxID=3231911 RepID=UPI003460FC30